MSDQLHKFIFEGMPVRGMLVRLTDSWKEVLQRRQGGQTPFPPEVRHLLGEMAAAATLMQANLKFNGALILQVQGDGPVKLAVAEANSDLSYRVTAKLVGDVEPSTPMSRLINLHGQGRCAITLDPKDRLPGQQPYQGVVPLHGDHREPLERISEVLEHYMRQSEQLDTKLILAANDEVAAGLLIQRLPVQGQGNLAGGASAADEERWQEDFQRIVHLAHTLQPDELLGLEASVVLHRLFWEEPLRRFEPFEGAQGPRFACSCSRQRVSHMLLGLGRAEVDDVVAEQGQVDVGCEFCGLHYHFDAVDVAGLFAEPSAQAPGSSTLN